MAIGSEYVEVVKKWKVPTTTREVEQFLGFANYHRTFIKNFADLSYPLYQLTGKKPYKWRDSEQEAFDKLVEALTTTPLLALPNNKDPFILDTDASNFAIGAELIQVQDGVERPVAYGSFSLTHEQKRPGKRHQNADALSRLPDLACPQNRLAAGNVLKHNLPCGACDYCTRAHQSWLGFQEDVDNVIPLASHQDCKSFEPIGPHTVLPSSLISDDNLMKQDNTQHIHVITEDNTRPDSSIPQDEDQNVTSHVKENLSTFQVQQQVFESTNQDIVNQNQNVCHSSVEIVTTPLDPNLELILVWLRDKTEPSEATIFRCSPIAKKYWINKDMFYLDDNGKLDPPWKGPGLVCAKLSSYVYKIKLQKTVLTINHDRLKPCKDREVPPWLKQCQNRLQDGEDVTKATNPDLYCFCRKPDDGLFMIQCDFCDEWYHGACIDLTPALADTMVKFRYPRCQDVGTAR
ncbi:Hypothetical predicted protein [Mytilus galloprovincialis]|uniref:Zinc finger PHD-type domain-containing protein n=1 Tax=Mytilus galloprovincialis TaxID=29158 RepID=A0A8B6DXJ2_MYTGA|nr:Hypothetical predicted protein [Mytilus galloprovincialis]